MLDRMTRIVSGLEVRAEAMRQNLERLGSAIYSEQVLLALVRRGVTRDEAYRWVQRCALAGGDFRRAWRRTPTCRRNFRAKRSKTSLTCRITCGISTLSHARPGGRGWSGLSFSTRARRSRSTGPSDPDLLIQHFKDDATAFNAKKRGTIVDKGVLNNRMSEVLSASSRRKESQPTSCAPVRSRHVGAQL
jgi:hypothetical protein